ncbi:MAG: class I SAM-dependent methyltransferase [archaeon]|jgi:SAM-dependent methyltransferase
MTFKSPHRKRLDSIVIPILKSNSNLRSLDVGSGKKETSYGAGFIKNCTTVDINEGADIRADAARMPSISNGSFEFVFSIEAFFSFKEPVLALGEMNRVLKKGGKILFTSEYAFCGLQDSSVFGFYSKEALIYMVEKAGFSEIQIIPMTGFMGSFGNLLYRKLNYLNKKKFFVFPLLIAPYFFYALDIFRNEKFSSGFVVLAKKNKNV